MQTVSVKCSTGVGHRDRSFTTISVGQAVLFPNMEPRFLKFGRARVGNEPRGLYYETFYGRNLRIFVISSIVFVLCKPFQPSVMFVGKARSLPQSASLTRKHSTRLERIAIDKHSSLLRKSVNYGRKKFYSTGPCIFQLIFGYFLSLYHCSPILNQASSFFCQRRIL